MTRQEITCYKCQQEKKYPGQQYTLEGLLLSSVAFGVIFSPISLGLIWFLLFIIVWEILLQGWCWWRRDKYQEGYLHWYYNCDNIEARTGVVLGSIFGWIIGRQFSCQSVL